MKFLCSCCLLATLLFACDAPAATAAETADPPAAEAPAPEETPAVNYEVIYTDAARIATALMAAPAASRAESTVIGYNSAGEFGTLKEGTNEFICVADDPEKEGFNAACYHKNMEPFMARGRELRAEGKTAQEIFAIREAEAKAGTLDVGTMGATLHVYSGPRAQYDPATGEVDGATYRYVVYLPFATAASTGLPESPIAPNHPWIMNPGTHRAHIMISPLADRE